MKQVVNRMTNGTPKFFRNVRTIGLCLIAASGVVLAKSGEVPDIVITVAGYVAVAGSVMTAVSQAAVKNEQE